MEIKSKQEAFSLIENSGNMIPYSGIEYLYKHEKDAEILEKLVFSLENAYNPKVYLDPKTGYFLNTPLWYGIVAENHIDDLLIDPIIKLYAEKDDWDFLNEQGLFLIGKSCKELGNKAVERFFQAIENASKEKEQKRKPYLFLHECLYYVDKEIYSSRILKILEEPEYYWLESLIVHLGYIQFEKAKPRLEELLEYFQSEGKEDFKTQQRIIELKDAIEELEAEELEEANFSGPFFESREDWKTHYKKMENHIISEQVETPVNETTVNKKKTGRNEPCPCGSGKKYKKCCLDLDRIL